jgi:hypothetical protein
MGQKQSEVAQRTALKEDEKKLSAVSIILFLILEK